MRKRQGSIRMKTIFALLACLLSVRPAVSCTLDSLTVRDSQEIKHLAQRKVEKGLNDLLNTVAFEDLGEFERKALRADSYGNSVNKIFSDGKVIVEDDVNPEHISAKTGTDLTVERYLADFELFYPKSADRTISFSDFTVSNVKKLDYYYVKVYFKSSFKGQHSQIKVPYRQHNRVAEVRAEQKGKKWLTYITRVGFVGDGDSSQNSLNDVVLARDITAADSSRQTSEVESAAEIARDKERETEKKALEEYNRWLTEGDKAFASKDYDKALEAYTEAEKRNDFDDLLPRRKIYQVKRAFEKEKQTAIDLLREYLAKGNIAQKNRNYSEAVGYYKKALELKPDSVALGETIRSLNQKSSVKTELDEKFNLGKYAEVIKDYSRILKKEKNNSDYYLGRGLAYVATTDLDKALKDFSQAIELDFANLAALKARADLYAMKKDFPKAAADLTSYLNIDNTAAGIYSKRAGFRILTRNVSGAFEDYSKAIELFPKNASHYFNRGMLHVQTENYPSSIADFSSAITLNNAYNEAYYNRGLSHIKLNEVGLAGGDFAQLRKLAITTEQTQQISSIAAQYFQIAFNALSQKKFQNAIEGFDHVISVLPTHAEAWYHRAKGLEGMADSLAAIESYDMAILSRSDYSEAYHDRGRLWFGMKKYENAAGDYKKAFQLAPTNFRAAKGMADAYFALKSYDNAMDAYEIIKVNEKKIGTALANHELASAYNNLGLCYLQNQMVTKGIEEFDRSLDKNSAYSDAYFNRGRAYELENNLRRAITDYKKATTLDVSNSSKYLSLGLALYKDEEYEEAIGSLSLAIEKDPANLCCQAASRSKRGDCYMLTKQYRNAIDDYVAAFQLDSATKASDALYNIGIAFLHQKQPDQSIKFLSEVGNKDRLKGQCYYAIGCAYIQQRKQDEALKWFAKSFQTGMITKSYIRKDKLLESIDRSFAGTAAFKELVNQHVIK
ncbi:tetratricopeptide repeat protein [Dyadobacter bucti]|uniref:tetratricopeptide repeat protein n=1 Tax=Dyadobacter bucti TaxID=2572203 RepID=UPI0011098A73|nr:tetratricopeptide repeat protein [Dyadobacter bucti]